MPASRRLLLVLATILSIAGQAGVAAATTGPDPARAASEAVGFFRDTWQSVQREVTGQAQNPAPPRAIPPAGPDGPVLRLDDTADPLALEQRVRGFLRDAPVEELRLTVPDGSALAGNWSVAAGDT